MRYINHIDSFLGRLSEQDNEYLVECVASFNEMEGATTGGNQSDLELVLSNSLP
jgi:hypothetical protein